MIGLRGPFLHFHTFISSILWYWKYWSETNLWFMNKLTIYKTTGENMVPESKDQMEKGAILIMTIAALQSIFNWHCWQSTGTILFIWGWWWWQWQWQCEGGEHLKRRGSSNYEKQVGKDIFEYCCFFRWGDWCYLVTWSLMFRCL